MASSTSIFLQWGTVEHEDQNGVITGYIITATETGSGQSVGSWTSESINFTLTSLKPYTVYSLSVSALNSAGLGPSSAPSTAQTLEDGKQAIYGMCSY